MMRPFGILTITAMLFAAGSLLAPPGLASVTRGIDRTAPHIVAVSAYGSPLLPGKVTLLGAGSRRILMSIASAKILPLQLEPEPRARFSFGDNALLAEVAPYLPFVLALFILTLFARREVRRAAIPAPRPKPPPGPWTRGARRG
jgi:hypothetical protein